jgi:predicted DsbA family dithiol-disulfide isomerase
MRVDVWSDVVCPWCYIGKRRLETAIAALENPGVVEIVHRSFQLNPAAPIGETSKRRDKLMAKYRLSVAQVEAMDARMEQTAAVEGQAVHLTDDTLTGNTAHAHAVVHLARVRGTQDAVIERLFLAYFTEQRSVFDAASLVALAVEGGLDAEEVREALRTDFYADAVQADGAQARSLGASGVPFFVIDSSYAVSGAQPVNVFVEALTRALDSHSTLQP